MSTLDALSKLYLADRKLCQKGIGVSFANQSQQFKKIISRKNLDNYYENVILKIFPKFNIIPLFSKQQYKGHACERKFVYKWKCTKCGNQFQQRIKNTAFNQQYDQLLRCLNCYPFLRNTSKLQLEVIDFCKQFYPQLDDHNREIIKPQQLDIYIEELNLAIEFNGIYFHSLKFKHPTYHIQKFKKCLDKNINLFFIWQQDWLLRKSQIKQQIENFLKNPYIIKYKGFSKIQSINFKNNIFEIQRVF